VQKALASLPGVTKVEVDAENAKATCIVEAVKFDQKKALAALEEEGFPGSKVMN
jgi:copper chaperone CopZ